MGRCALGALLVASAAAALLPDWATRLKAQNYAGYVDLNLALDASDTVARAGGTLRVAASVLNAGSGDAHDVHIDAQLQPAVLGLTTLGCVGDPGGYPTCLFGAPLGPDAMAVEVLLIDVPPTARGSLMLDLQAAADEPDAFPGQEIGALVLPIEAHVDLRSQLACAEHRAQVGKPLACTLQIQNAGPASALQADLSIDAAGLPVDFVACQGSSPRACPSASAPLGASVLAELRPGDFLRLTFAVTLPSDWSTEQWTISATAAQRADEIDDNPADNSGSVEIVAPLFADGFQGPAN